MTINELRVLMNGAFGRKVPAEFAAEDYDYEQALHDEIAKLVCDKNGRFDRYNFLENKISFYVIKIFKIA